MTIIEILERLDKTAVGFRNDLVENVNMQNYGSNTFNETDMWILRKSAENDDYLQAKLYEASELSLDIEAPSENEELSLDDSDLELSLDDSDLELSLDDSDLELSLDDSDLELSLDDDKTTQVPVSVDELETSLMGVGILPLIAEIQEKVAKGKPSLIELAALKAMNKMY